ncbi:MAG TPA: hypothetical protein PK876_10405 [Elusimicrobiota bacterium]|nr:hypothetical protein [Elusimicrobiota bacterium]
MSYKVYFKDCQTYLRADVAGEWSPGNEAEDAKKIWTKTSDECRAKGYNKLLSVWKVPGKLPTLAAYDIGTSADTLNWEKRCKVAVVQLYRERYVDSLFAETVALNRGIQVKVFDNEPQALEWLLQEEKNPLA